MSGLLNRRNSSLPSLQEGLGLIYESPHTSDVDLTRPATTKLHSTSASTDAGSRMSRYATMGFNSVAAVKNRTLPVMRWLSGSSDTGSASVHQRSASDAGPNVANLSPTSGEEAEERTATDAEDEGEGGISFRDLETAIHGELFGEGSKPSTPLPDERNVVGSPSPISPPDNRLPNSPSTTSTPPDSIGRSSTASHTKTGLKRLLPASFTFPSPSSSDSVPRPNLHHTPAYSRLYNTTVKSRASLDSIRSLAARVGTTATVMTPIAGSPTSWLFQDGHSSLVDAMLADEDKAPTLQEELEHIRKKYLTPKIPLVFCHGLLGWDSVSLGTPFASLQISHWKGIKEVLSENGIEVLITRVPATSGVEERAKVLEKRIAETYPGREVHLIGHSMGGLDCRYLTSKLKPTAFKIRSVTTIGTPHRGSYFADYFLASLGKHRIPALASFLEYLPNGGGDGKAFEGLTLEAMKRFNDEVPDVEGVEYFSWGASFQPSLVDAFKWPHRVIHEKEGPNDGLVSVFSSQWGKYLGTLEDVNHLDLVGWVNTARYKWAELTGKGIRFKPASFYLEVAARLAEEVEGITWDDDDTHDDLNINGYGHDNALKMEHRKDGVIYVDGTSTKGHKEHKDYKEHEERPHMRARGSSKSKKRISASVDLTKPKKENMVPC